MRRGFSTFGFRTRQHPRQRSLGVLTFLAVCMALPVVADEPSGTATEGDVAAGRQALDQSWDYVWYDDTHDDVRTIEVSLPWDWNWDLQLPTWRWGGFSMNWMETVAWIVLAILLAALTTQIIRAYLRREQDLAQRNVARATLRTDTTRRAALAFLDRHQAVDLLAAARACYQRGQFNEAMVYLFSHELVELDRRAHLRLERWKTNRQYLGEIGGGPLGALLARTMVNFEEVFFGGRQLEQADFEVCWSQLERFQALAERRST